MSRSRLACKWTLLLALVSGSCRVGPKIENVQAAYVPAGIATVVRTREEVSYEGELLSVGEDGLLLLVDGHLTSVPLGLIEYVDSLPVLRGPASELDRSGLKKLRGWSRFPQGVSNELELALLSAYGQVEVTRVER